MEFLRRVTLDGQTFEGTDANVLRAIRLMRLFNEQVETRAKLRARAVSHMSSRGRRLNVSIDSRLPR
jgi:hypothetical protein